MESAGKIRIGSAWSLNIQIGGAQQTIESISDTTPCVVTLTDHGFSDGDNITIAGNNNATTGPNAATNGRWVVAGVTTNTFTLTNSVATGFGTLTGGTIAKAINSNGGSITFTAAQATWAAGQSIFTDTAIGTVAIIAPTFAWGDSVVSPTAGQAIGYFTLSLTGAQTFTLDPGEYYIRIYFVDSTGAIQEPMELEVKVTY